MHSLYLMCFEVILYDMNIKKTLEALHLNVVNI